MSELATNVLHSGDNLDLPRRSLPDASADLIDLDPSFNPNGVLNVNLRDESASE